MTSHSLPLKTPHPKNLTDEMNSTVIGSVDPDLTSIDGHLFKINYDVPQEVTEALYELNFQEAKYEDIPREFLKYEVVEGDYDAAQRQGDLT